MSNSNRMLGLRPLRLNDLQVAQPFQRMTNYLGEFSNPPQSFALRSGRAPIRAWTFGTSGRDVCLKASELILLDHHVQFKVGNRNYTVPYVGEVMQLGEKRFSAASLEPFVGLLSAIHESGGGGIRTAKHIANLQIQNNLPVAVGALDTAEPSTTVAADCATCPRINKTTCEV